MSELPLCIELLLSAYLPINIKNIESKLRDKASVISAVIPNSNSELKKIEGSTTIEIQNAKNTFGELSLRYTEILMKFLYRHLYQ
jgi:hypothetical protein